MARTLAGPVEVLEQQEGGQCTKAGVGEKGVGQVVRSGLGFPKTIIKTLTFIPNEMGDLKVLHARAI